MSDIVRRKAIGGDTVAIIDKDDPRSVFHLLPEVMQRYVETIAPEVWERSFAELTRDAKPDVDLKQLRIAFWMDYERCKRNGADIVLAQLCTGIMSIGRFKKHVLGDPFKLAYLLTPPEDYRVKLEEMLQVALEEERKILTLPNVKKKITFDKEGNEHISETTDASIAAVKHKIRESLQNRLYGLPVARIHQVNRNIDSTDDGKKIEDMELPELQAYVEELKQKKNANVIDVEPATSEGESEPKDG